VQKEINGFKTLSAKEVELLTRLEYEGKDIYTSKDVVSFCRDKQRALYLIRKLLTKKRLKKIVKNVYLFVPMKAPGGQWTANEYLIAKALTRGAFYYIGYSTVFSPYGFTDQVAQVICIANDKYSLSKSIFGIKYKMIKVLPNRLYGFETRKIKGEEVAFSKKERALIDVFEFYDVKKASNILADQASKIDMPVFIDYLSQYPVQKIRRRIGYFLDKLGANRRLLAKIDIGKTGYSTLYDGGSNKGKIDNKWRLIING